MRPFDIFVQDPDFTWEVGDALAAAMWRRRRSIQRRQVTKRGKYPRDLVFFYHLFLRAEFLAATLGRTKLLEDLTKRAYELGWVRVGKEC